MTFNVTDLCESGQDVATFTVTPPSDLVISTVADKTVNACEYADQDALNAAFAIWIGNFGVSGGCDPQGSDLSGYSAPDLCEGGAVTVTFDVTDVCESGQDEATFTVTPPSDLVISTVADKTVNSCSYADQDALNAAFATWLGNFGVSGGCDPQGSDLSVYSAPDLCEGGAVTVTFDVTDLCESGQDEATFTVTPPSDLVISTVADKTVNSCSYADQDALDAAFATWLGNFGVSGGCDPQGSDLSGYSAPDLCTGGSTEVTFSVTDLCESGQDVATFTVTPPSDLVISTVADKTVNSCSYADQDALDAAFATWIGNFGVSGGCDPQGSDLSGYSAPDLCEGGSVTVTFDVTDLCESGHDVATFTVTPPSDLVISTVADKTVNACDYADQDALDAAFATWLGNFGVSGGCDPQGSDLSGYTAPALCAGGSTEVTFNVTDLCESGQDVATFTVTPPSDLVISTVADKTVNSCSYADQDALDAAFAIWIDNFGVSGGCDPQGTFAAEYTAPDLCAGGSTEVIFNVTDLCESGQDVATFTVTPPSDLVISTVADKTVNACDYADQDALDAAFAIWIGNFGVSGGCDPQDSDLSGYTAPDLCAGGSTEVTFSVTDRCESGQDVATFKVIPDTEAPEIHVEPYSETICESDVPASLNASWTDNCADGGDLTAYPVMVGEDECSQTYEYTFTAQDDCGNETTETVTIVREIELLGECETIFGYNGDLATCFLELPQLKNNRWGWTNQLTAEGTYTLDLYAGAAQCKTGKADYAGTATVDYADGYVTVTYNMADNYVLNEAHVYVGCEELPSKNGKPTVAPGQYPFNPDLGGGVHTYTVGPIRVEGDPYVIVHGVACEVLCDCTSGGSIFDGNDGGQSFSGADYSCDVDMSSSAKVSKANSKNKTAAATSDISTFPVPFKDNINVTYDFDYNSDVTIQVFDMRGQHLRTYKDKKVTKGSVTRMNIDFALKANQMYILKVTTDRETFVKQIVSSKK